MSQNRSVGIVGIRNSVMHRGSEAMTWNLVWRKTVDDKTQSDGRKDIPCGRPH